MLKQFCFFIFTISNLFFCELFSQNKNFEEEVKSGYRGSSIQNIMVPDSCLNFLLIGDWGRKGEYFQKEVADQLAKASVDLDASFIISTGDNFYPKGVASVDDPLWLSSYENVYSQFSLQKDWFVVLGNHDYKINPQAEVEYTKKSARWKMPDRYFFVKMAINGDTNTKALFIFLDTSPLIDKYYNDTEYSKQIMGTDTSAQKKWLIKTLKERDKNIKWTFVVGHHPLYSSGKRIKSAETLQFRKSMQGIFDKFKVDAYLCGHEHHLEYTKPEGKTHYFISGAGSEKRDVKGKLPETKFSASDHGFMTFSVSKSKLLFQVINWEGKILYSETLKQ